MLVFLGSVMLLFDLPNSFMEYIFILMLLFGITIKKTTSSILVIN